MNSRETKEQISARARANVAWEVKVRALAEQQQRFEYLKEAEAKAGVSSFQWIKNKFQRGVKKIPAVEDKSGPSVSSKLDHVFSYEELNLATNCFDHKIGDGGFSSIYRGKLEDDRTVAVRVHHDCVKWTKEFMNDVRVLSDISHPNLVSLYGCTYPKSQKLLLVYEFVPNGTIYDHLHGKLSPLPWAVRIQVAVETAKALTYLHSLEPPIIHRDVKTSNILLDNNFHVKVAGFDMCRLLPLHGTHGYQDYVKSSKLTVKGDVYSFGGVLLELISGERTADVNRQESDIRMIDLVAELAHVCLQPEANVRPSMMEVLSKLKAIRDGTEPFTTSSSPAHLFSYEELNEATNHFSERIGSGGYGSVYSGKLHDDRMVAVKVLNEGQNYVKEFANEVRLLSSIHHSNLVSLYGSTDRESQQLMLVYEFLPNGTISEHLHGKLSPLSWDMRMEIAIETATALTYLHSLEPPIVHRDVKTSNILLDEDLHVKVADFGICRLLPPDETSVTTRLQGTQGYLDPHYEKTFKLTAKSDVYSFGVVLLELISGKEAIDVTRKEDEIYLFRMALSKILKKEVEQLIDTKIGYHSNSENKRMIDAVVEHACVCLQPETNRRPSMDEVLSTLKAIRDGTEPIRPRRTRRML